MSCSPVRAVLLAAAMALVAAAPAAALPGAADPMVIAEADDAEQTATFVAPTGDQVIVRAEDDQSRLAATIRRDGVAGPSHQISSAAVPETPATMAFTPDGGALSVWGDASVIGATADAGRRAPGALFLPAAAPATCGRFSAVAESTTGTLLLACSLATTTAGGNRMLYGVGSGLALPSSLSQTAPVSDPFLIPKVAWSPSGAFGVVGFGERSTSTSSTLRTVRVRPDGSTANSIAAATSPFVELSGVVALDDGRIVVTAIDAAGPFFKVVNGGSLGQRMSLGTTNTGVGSLERDGAGRLHTVVDLPSGGGRQLQTLVVAPDGTTSTPVDVLATPASVFHPQLFVAPDGTETVTFSEGSVTRAAVRPAGGTFGAALAVTPASASGVSAALTPTGDVVVAWVQPAGAGQVSVVLGGVDTGAPPSLTGVAAPAQALAGQPVHLAATATDPMGVASVGWDPGDGSGAVAGGSLDHVYAAPGTYTATVTAVDRAHNASTASRTVQVVTAGTGGTGAAGAGGGNGTGDPCAPGGGAASVGGAAGCVADVAPTVGLSLPRRVRFADLRKRGLSVTVTLSEPANLRGVLTGRARTVTLRAAGGVELGSATVPPGPLKATLRVKPKAKLLGRRARALKLSLSVTATDATGHATTATRSVRVRR